jgi:hypothetical protein
MQEMDDRFQVRSLQPQQNVQQSANPAAAADAAASSSRSATPAAGSGSRPTSARSRPLGAFNNVSSRRE